MPWIGNIGWRHNLYGNDCRFVASNCNTLSVFLLFTFDMSSYHIPFLFSSLFPKLPFSVSFSLPVVFLPSVNSHFSCFMALALDASS